LNPGLVVGAEPPTRDGLQIYIIRRFPHIDRAYYYYDLIKYLKGRICVKGKDKNPKAFCKERAMLMETG